jgi:hypothetical protein
MVATEVVRAGSLAATALAITPDGKPIVAAALTNSSFAWQWNGSQWTEMVRIPPGESASVLPLWADNFVMTVNATGVPYLACRNLDSSHKASCFSWNGFRWNSVGSPGFSAGGINALDMACDGTGNPAVTFQETISEKTYGTAMRYTGTEWDTIGTPGMHTNAVGYTALAIDPSGVIWAVFTEVAVAPYAATVKRFTGTTWETVGEPGFSATETEFPRIAIAADGNPWVAYRDAANSRVVVKRWDGSAWNTVGDTPFPQTGGNYCNLAFDGDGNAWLASTEMVGDDEKPVVRRWTGSSWQEVAGTTAPDQGAVEYLCLAIAGNRAIFIAYCEEDGSEQVVRVQRFY